MALTTRWKDASARDLWHMELFVPAVADLQPATPLALDDDFAVPLAQFDLANVSAGVVNFFGDQGRALLA